MRVEVAAHDADGVAQVPQDERAGVVGEPGDLGQVGDPGRLVGDVGEQDDTGAVGQGAGDEIGGDPFAGSGSSQTSCAPVSAAMPSAT